jgi:phosphatidylcholine synthase
MTKAPLAHVERTLPNVKAWAVHALTASGAVMGLLALVAISEEAWRHAFVWMGVAVFIDAIDGTLARRCHVRILTPSFDGSLLDNIIDYFNYVAVPAFFLYASGVTPGRYGLIVCAAILVASAYQFCQHDSKTADHYFKGFPCYWNILVFYLFFLGMPPWVNFAIILILAAAVFVPIKYIYPSRTRLLRRTTLVLSGVWGVLVVIALAQYPATNLLWVYASLGYVAYYFAVSLIATMRSQETSTQ